MFGETLDAMCAVCLPLYRKGILHGPYDPVIKAHKSLEVCEQSRHEAHTYRALAIIPSFLLSTDPPITWQNLDLFCLKDWFYSMFHACVWLPLPVIACGDRFAIFYICRLTGSSRVGSRVSKLVVGLTELLRTRYIVHDIVSRWPRVRG